MSRTRRNPPTFTYEGRRRYVSFRAPACGSRLRAHQSSVDELGEHASNRNRTERGRIVTSYDDPDVAALREVYERDPER